MAYTIKGTYVASCDCVGVCPCPVDGTERASVAVADGSVTVSGKSDYMFEPFTGPDGSPTTVRGAMFAFAPEYEIGKTTGKSDAFGLSFDSNYGESAQFEYSTEATGVVHPRA